MQKKPLGDLSRGRLAILCISIIYPTFMADSTANYNMWCLFQKIRKNQSIQGKEIYSRKNYQDRRFFCE